VIFDCDEFAFLQAHAETQKDPALPAAFVTSGLIPTKIRYGSQLEFRWKKAGLKSLVTKEAGDKKLL